MMVPATYPTNSSGQMIIGVDAGAVAAGRWIDWIPVKVNGSATITTGSYGTSGNEEGIPISQVSPSGLTAWKDYIPVSTVADSDAWQVSATGYIPVIGTIV